MSADVREYRRDTMKQIELLFSYGGNFEITIRAGGYGEEKAISIAVGVLLAQLERRSVVLAADAVPKEVKDKIVEEWIPEEGEVGRDDAGR